MYILQKDANTNINTDTNYFQARYASEDYVCISLNCRALHFPLFCGNCKKFDGVWTGRLSDTDNRPTILMKASLAKYPHHHSIFLDIFSKSVLSFSVNVLQ